MAMIWFWQGFMWASGVMAALLAMLAVASICEFVHRVCVKGLFAVVNEEIEVPDDLVFTSIEAREEWRAGRSASETRGTR